MTGEKKIKEGFLGQKMIVIPPSIIKDMKNNAITNSIHPTAIGYYPKAEGHDRERKLGSQQYILIYCVQGSGLIYVSGKKFELSPNTFFIIPKQEAHHYGTGKDDPWSIYWIHFTGNQADWLFNRYKKNGLPEVQGIPYDDQRIKFFSMTYSLLDQGMSFRNLEVASIQLMQFLASLIFHEELYPFIYSEDRLTKSIDYMKRNLDQYITIEQLASHANYSVSHYTYMFKKKTGLSPIKYFNLLRIQKSCQYLCFTDMVIKEICDIIGYEDPYYFSRAFKKLMGISPARYRSRYQKQK